MPVFTFSSPNPVIELSFFFFLQPKVGDTLKPKVNKKTMECKKIRLYDLRKGFF
jgi:hypothetical protein